MFPLVNLSEIDFRTLLAIPMTAPYQPTRVRARDHRVSQLYQLCKRVGERLEATHAGDAMALLRAKGQLATKAGFLVTMVSPADSDDPVKIVRLQQAAAELGISL